VSRKSQERKPDGQERGWGPSQGDGDLNPSTITTHTGLLRHKPAQPTHLPPTPPSIRLKREKGHVPSTRITRRLPTLLRLSTVQNPKRNERPRTETSHLRPDPTKLLIHGDVAVTASEEFGSERQPALGREVFVEKGDQVDVGGSVTEKFPWKWSDRSCFRVVLTVHHRDFS